MGTQSSQALCQLTGALKPCSRTKTGHDVPKVGPKPCITQ